MTTLRSDVRDAGRLGPQARIVRAHGDRAAVENFHAARQRILLQALHGLARVEGEMGEQDDVGPARTVGSSGGPTSPAARPSRRPARRRRSAPPAIACEQGRFVDRAPRETLMRIGRRLHGGEFPCGRSDARVCGVQHAVDRDEIACAEQRRAGRRPARRRLARRLPHRRADRRPVRACESPGRPCAPCSAPMRPRPTRPRVLPARCRARASAARPHPALACDRAADRPAASSRAPIISANAPSGDRLLGVLRHVDHRNAAPPRRLDVDRVDADAVLDDALEAAARSRSRAPSPACSTSGAARRRPALAQARPRGRRPAAAPARRPRARSAASTAGHFELAVGAYGFHT